MPSVAIYSDCGKNQNVSVQIFGLYERPKKNRYPRKMSFIIDKKQLDLLSSITNGCDFASALNSEKRNIN